MKNEKMKTVGIVNASPAEFAIHQRMGKIRHIGRGISFFKLPWIDRYTIIPSSTRTIQFRADQITAENQGVEISGFAAWRVADAERAAANFDFTDAEAALGAIGGALQDVVESAIRHQVARLTIEDALRKRGSIILQLKEEMAYVAGLWGIAVETVEIKSVRILSRQLFENLQAPFRNAIRFESDQSAIETERRLAEQRTAQQEELARQKHQLEIRRIELEESKLPHEAELDAKRFELKKEEASRRLALSKVDQEIEQERIAVANMENAMLALLRNLPDALKNLKIGDVHLGDPSIVALLRRIASGMNHGGLRSPQGEE
jgi:regulator of protease activity HflC (stomatin/prohibitin superfamily)